MKLTQHDYHFWDERGQMSGGVTYGVGYSISWQRGKPKEVGRNGALLEDITKTLLERVEYKNARLPASEYLSVISHLKEILTLLDVRHSRLAEESLADVNLEELE